MYRISKLKNLLFKRTSFFVFRSLTLRQFCNIHRLNVDKLKIDKDMGVKTIDELTEKFDINKSIIEFGPEVSWENTVLKSEIPVVVDVYAK
jgi:heme oxygenase